MRAPTLRQLAIFTAILCGATMILAGIVTAFTSDPHPELWTGGAALILATGLLGRNGNGNGHSKTGGGGR